MIENRVNTGDVVLAENTPAAFIQYLNEHDIPCTLGNAPIAGQIVVNVSYSGSEFSLNAVYAQEGSYFCTYMTRSTFTLTEVEGYVYQEDVSMAEADLLVAEEQAKAALFVAHSMSYFDYAGVLPVEDDNIDAFLAAIETQYGIVLVAGTQAPSEDGIVINISSVGGTYMSVNATVYVRYGIETADFDFSELA